MNLVEMLLTIDIAVAVVVPLVGFTYIALVARDIHRTTIEAQKMTAAYGAGNLRQGLKLENLIEAVRENVSVN